MLETAIGAENRKVSPRVSPASLSAALLGVVLAVAGPAGAATVVGTGTTLGGRAFSFTWTLPEDSPRTQLSVFGADILADYGPTPDWHLVVHFPWR